MTLWAKEKDIAVRAWHILLLWTLAFVVAAVVAAFWSRGAERLWQSKLLQTYLLALSSGIMVLIALIVPELRRVFGQVFARSKVSLGNGDLLLTWALLFAWSVGLQRLLFYYAANLVAPESLFSIDSLTGLPSQDWTWLLITLVVTVLIAPLGEEFVFRGLLMNLWIRERGVWAGVILSSIAFGLFHFQRAPFATGFGVIMAIVYLKTKSLWPCVLLHAAYNLTAVLVSRSGVLVKTRATVTDIGAWGVEVVLAVLFVPLAYCFWRRFKPLEKRAI